MSHITKVEGKIKERDLNFLKSACDMLGFNFVEGAKKFVWYSGKHKCDHKINVPGAEYEIGVVQKGEEYELLLDEYDNRLIKSVGRGCGKILQRTAANKAKFLARKEGWTVREKTDDKNNIIIRLQEN